MVRRLSTVTTRSWRIGRLLLGSSLTALLPAAALAPAAYAQETFASIDGSAVFPDGAPAAGIQVEITHLPSGTRTIRTLGNRGAFVATGLRPGGPYRARFFGEAIDENIIEGFFARPGEPLSIDVTVTPTGFEEILVLGQRPEAIGIGSVSTYDAERIERTPVNLRSLQEIARLDPQVFLDLGQGDEQQGISVLGFNTRFNNLVIDGASQTDSFGDNFTGFSTRRSPISLDAIESFSVETSPFDVQNSNFQGGQINITTKSGTNEVHGSLFFQRTGGFLTRDVQPNFNDPSDPTTINEEPENIFGATLSGPIIKDKLFFFASYEEFRETDQLANGPIGSGAVNETDFLTIDTFNEIAQISIDNFGFDPGDFADVGTFSDNERKILLKLDWNINLNHRAALTFQRTTSSNIDQNEAPGLDSPSSFANFTADDPVVLTGQLVSNWTDNFNTLLRVSYRETRRQTESIITDTPFGETSLIDIVPVFDDAGGFDLAETVTLGPAADNLINIANSERLQLFARGEYTLANHRISFGYERDSQALFNLEVPTGSASFDFTPSDDFDPITGVGSSAIENFAAGIVDDVFISASITGDPLDLAADFTAVRHSLYIQDIWEPTPELQVLLGLRYERFAQDEAPEINPFFVDRFGFENNATLAGRDVFSPRFGLNYQPSYLPRTTFRTGLAVFAGSGPLTFLSAGFNINGITLGQALIDGADIEGPVDPNVIPQEALDALAALQDGLVEGEDGSTASLDPDFEIPRNLRFQFAIDQGFDLPYLGDDWNISLEVVHSEILQALQFVDLRLQEILPALPGAAAGIVRFNQIPSAVDTRFIGPIDTVQDRDDIIQDIQATNTSLGSSTVFSFDLNKNWDFGRFGEVLFNTGYAFTRSIDVSPANDTDSLQEVFETGAFDNINSPTPAPSIQAVPHNFNYSFTWQKRFWDGWRFQFNAFGNFRSGRATSLVIDDEFNISLGDLDNTEDGLLFIEGRQEEDFEQLVPGVSTTAAGRFIAPLPTGPDDPNFVFTNGLTFENTFGLLLEELPELAQFQGGLIPRNFLRAPNSHQLDLNAQLEIPVSRGQLILEGGIRNFLNLLDPRRGQIERFSIRENVFEAAFDVENEQIVIFAQENATGAGNGEGLIFNELEPSVGSIWRAQLGVRYRF